MPELLIREAKELDAEAITSLMNTLGYLGTESFMRARIAQSEVHPEESLLVAVNDAIVLGVISLHFIPQIALSGDFCRISYLCVAEDARNVGIGASLEAYATELAKARGCDRIEVHCNERRADAHRFYSRQGYQESPKYLIKSLKPE